MQGDEARLWFLRIADLYWWHWDKVEEPRPIKLFTTKKERRRKKSPWPKEQNQVNYEAQTGKYGLWIYGIKKKDVPWVWSKFLFNYLWISLISSPLPAQIIPASSSPPVCFFGRRGWSLYIISALFGVQMISPIKFNRRWHSVPLRPYSIFSTAVVTNFFCVWRSPKCFANILARRSEAKKRCKTIAALVFILTSSSS